MKLPCMPLLGGILSHDKHVHKKDKSCLGQRFDISPREDNDLIPIISDSNSQDWS